MGRLGINHDMKFLAIGGLSIFLVATFCAAQEEVTLSQFTLGDHLSGSEVDLSAMDGKVVVIEKWGTR